MAHANEGRDSRAWWLALAVIVLAGVAIRIMVWHTRLVVEDHDSIGYLRQIAAILREGPSRLTHMGTTTTPVFPVLGALFSLPGWGPLVGARLSSLVMSVVLLVASGLLGRAWLGARAALFGVALIAFAPALVDVGVAVLSEPSYLALVYAGLVPLAIRRQPYPWWVPVVTGLCLGLAFVDRIEGIGFLAAVPLLALVSRRPGRSRPPVSLALASSGIFVVAFLLTAAPQVVAVSRAAGRPMVNGRQLWSALMTAPGYGSYERRIYGLDFDPGQTNAHYAMGHPDLLGQGRAGFSLSAYAHEAVANASAMLQTHLSQLVGALALIFAGIAVIALIRARQHRLVIGVAGLLAVMLGIPLLHEFTLRHIVVAAPLLLLLAGKGIEETITAIVGDRARRPMVAGGALLTAVVVLAWVPQLHALTTNGDCGPEYCSRAIEATAAAVRSATPTPESTIIAARRRYLAYYAGTDGLTLPFVDTPALTRYLQLNHADFLFLDSHDDEDFPFYPDFAERPPAGFQLVYQCQDRTGRILRLYRVLPGSSGSDRRLSANSAS
ncbi:MAG TPA: hypothetical protein VFL95_06295 [Gemmatimonadales bacterium]|nr:hypothetical protein [Gemmatimonadales bacterium]